MSEGKPMIVIRTAEELASALALPLDPYLLLRLTVHRDRLLEYEDYAVEELALFLVVQPGDTLEHVNAASGVTLVRNGTFTFTPETIDRQGDWLEVLFILSDDGFGVVLFAPLCAGADPNLLAALQTLGPNDALSAAQ